VALFICIHESTASRIRRTFSSFFHRSGNPATYFFHLLWLHFSDLAKFGGGNASGQDTLRNISIWCIALTVLGVAAWVVQGGFLTSWMIFGEVQAKTVRKAMFEGMLDKDMEWYDLRKDGIASLLVRIHT
jgi:hypothetical protein